MELQKKCETCLFFRETVEACFTSGNTLINGIVKPKDTACGRHEVDQWKVRILNTKHVLQGFS